MKKLYYSYLLGVAVMLVSVAGCTKTDDYGNEPWQKQSTSRLTVADAKKFFEREASGFYTRASGHGSACGDGCGHDPSADKHATNPDRGLLNPGIITPNWINSEVVSGQTVSKVVTPMNTQYRYVAARKETDKNGKTKTYKSTIVQRLYVAKNNHGDNVVYIEVLIPDKGSRGEKNMPADIHDSKYSGIVMYFTVDNGFGWYYKFKSGKVVERISIYDVNAGNVDKVNAKIRSEIGRLIKYKTGGLSRNLPDQELGEVVIEACRNCGNKASECTCSECSSCGFAPCLCDYICVFCGKFGCFEVCFKCPDCMNPMKDCTCSSSSGGGSSGGSTGGGSSGGSTGGGSTGGSGTGGSGSGPLDYGSGVSSRKYGDPIRKEEMRTILLNTVNVFGKRVAVLHPINRRAEFLIWHTLISLQVQLNQGVDIVVEDNEVGLIGMVGKYTFDIVTQDNVKTMELRFNPKTIGYLSPKQIQHLIYHEILHYVFLLHPELGNFPPGLTNAVYNILHHRYYWQNAKTFMEYMYPMKDEAWYDKARWAGVMNLQEWRELSQYEKDDIKQFCDDNDLPY